MATAETAGTYRKEVVYRGTDMLHKARQSDRIARMSLVACGYLTPPGIISGPLQDVS